MIALGAAPAFAGPAETAFLQKLNSTWSGKGKLPGAESGAIACKIVFTAGGKSTKYQGRCNIPDMAQQAFSGSISYNDKAKRYEARSVGGTVPGVRKGDKLVFRSSSKSVGRHRHLDHDDFARLAGRRLRPRRQRGWQDHLADHLLALI